MRTVRTLTRLVVTISFISKCIGDRKPLLKALFVYRQFVPETDSIYAYVYIGLKPFCINKFVYRLEALAIFTGCKGGEDTNLYLRGSFTAQFIKI